MRTRAAGRLERHRSAPCSWSRSSLGLSDTDRDARVPDAGQGRSCGCAPGDYGIWYEEPHATSDNEVFEAPDGVEVERRPVENEPDPVVDLGGIGSQVGTGSRTAETIGKVTVAAAGSYRARRRLARRRGRRGHHAGPDGLGGLRARPPSARAGSPSPSRCCSCSFEIRRRTRPEPSPHARPASQWPSSSAPASAAALRARPRGPRPRDRRLGDPSRRSRRIGEPSYTITLQVDGGPPVASGHRVPLGQEARLVPGAEPPVRIEPVSGKVLAIDWHLT